MSKRKKNGLGLLNSFIFFHVKNREIVGRFISIRKTETEIDLYNSNLKIQEKLNIADMRTGDDF